MGKNTQRVQDMLDGNYKRKVQVGYDKVEQKRKIGERWTDSDGKEWEQKNGYIASIKKTPNAGIGDQCSDCKSLIVKPWDKEIFRWNGRCYYCQIDFEAELKSTNKFDEWKEKQDKRIKEQYIDEFEKENKELIKQIEKMKKSDNPFDTKVAMAMANENVSMTIKKNKS
jgi:hypothetical protein